MVVTWRNIVLGQRDNPLGMGSTVPIGTVPLVIGVVVVKVNSVAVKLGQISLFF